MINLFNSKTNKDELKFYSIIYPSPFSISIGLFLNVNSNYSFFPLLLKEVMPKTMVSCFPLPNIGEMILEFDGEKYFNDSEKFKEFIKRSILSIIPSNP